MKKLVLAALMGVCSVGAMAQASSTVKMTVGIVATDLTPTDGIIGGFKLVPFQATQPPPNNQPVGTEARAKGEPISGGPLFDNVQSAGDWYPSSAAGRVNDGTGDFGNGLAWGHVYGPDSTIDTTALLFASGSASARGTQRVMQASGQIPGATIEVAPYTKVVFTVSWVASGQAKTPQDTVVSNQATFMLTKDGTGVVFQKSSPERSWRSGPYNFSESVAGGLDRSTTYTLTNNTSGIWTGTLFLTAGAVVQKL